MLFLALSVLLAFGMLFPSAVVVVLLVENLRVFPGMAIAASRDEAEKGEDKNGEANLHGDVGVEKANTMVRSDAINRRSGALQAFAQTDFRSGSQMNLCIWS